VNLLHIRLHGSLADNLQLVNAPISTSQAHARKACQVVLRTHPHSWHGTTPRQKLGGHTRKAARQQRSWIEKKAPLVRSRTPVAAFVERLAEGVVPEEERLRHLVSVFVSTSIATNDSLSRNMVNIMLYVAEQCKIYYPPSEIEPMLNTFLPLLTRDVCSFASESHNHVQCAHIDVYYHRACASIFPTSEAFPSIRAISLQTLGRPQLTCEC
jgi:hypothetical protein